MKLINETIEMLGDSGQPLVNAFFKAQIIAHKIKDKEFSKWVKDEIQGYSNQADVPDYRTVRLTPIGNAENGARRYANLKLPVGGMTESQQDKFLVHRHCHSIGVIEEYARAGDDLVVNFDHRLFPLLRQGFDRSYVITSAWGQPPAGCFTQISNEARSRLLDLLLNIASLLPEEAEEDELATMPQLRLVNDMFKGSVFGNGANINVAIGEGNQVSHNSSTVHTNDVESLIRVMTENKVSEADVADLRLAIQKDTSSTGPAPKEFGPGVKSWMGGMISKAGTPAWEIPAQVGAGVLVTALSKFFGM